MTDKKPHISVVSPVYGAENILDELVKQIVKSVSEITPEYEIILVDDCGPDNSWTKIKANAQINPKVKGLKLSRNFGQHSAISAGLEASNGDYIIVMDCDLQDNPADIQKLLDKAGEGFDTVFTKRLNRQHSFIKKKLSKIYQRLFSFLSDEGFSLDNGSLFLINRKVVNTIINLQDKPRLMGQVIRWVGFNIGFVEVVHQKRYHGKSSYSVSKLLALVWDGWISNSDKLIKMITYLGIIVSSLSFTAGITIATLKFFIDFAVGWSSIIIVILFSTGLILMALGVVGIYIAKIFEQTKNRPLYIINEKVNFLN